MTDSTQSPETPEEPSGWKGSLPRPDRSVRVFLWAVLWMVFWIVVVLSLPLGLLFEFASQTSPGTGLYIGLIVALIVPPAVGAKISFRLAGFDWDWTFASLVALHTLVIEILLITEVWQWRPTMSGMKGVVLAFVFAMLVMMAGAAMRVFRKKAWRALALFQVVTLINIFYLWYFLTLSGIQH